MRYCPLTKDYVDDCGECEMCPDEENEKEERRIKKLNNKSWSLNHLLELGIGYKKLSQWHYRIGDYDFWPTTGKYLNRKTNDKGRGVLNLIKKIK